MLTYYHITRLTWWFYTRYTHGKAVPPSVCLSNAWIVTKPKKVLARFLTLY